MTTDELLEILPYQVTVDGWKHTFKLKQHKEGWSAIYGYVAYGGKSVRVGKAYVEKGDTPKEALLRMKERLEKEEVISIS